MTDRELLELVLKKVTGIDERVTGIEERMATKEDVADLPAVKVAVVEMSNVVNQIKQTLDHQGKILETLSMKYIEHETEIRELKRIK